MLNAIPMVISKESWKNVFVFAESNSALAKNLYNAALFRIRQVFTGWDKEHRTDLEQLVFDELIQTKLTYKSFKPRRVLSYAALDKIMRATQNPDFFAGLPMQSAQAVIKDAVHDFKAWLDALKQYKKTPSLFTGKPRMPKYCKSYHKTFTVTNQDVVIYPVIDKNGNTIGSELKLPGFKKQERIPLSYINHKSNLRTVTFKPYYDKYIMTFVIENMASPFYPDMPYMAGLDFGTDNIAAIACTDGSSVIYKGGAILSSNQFFAKEKAKAVSIITKGHKYMFAASKYLASLSRKHDCFLKDQMHKISTAIIRYCVEHRVGVLIVGVNKLWKQKSNIGKVNNQNFVSVPHLQLRHMIEYKALQAGIDVVEQEESYTSKADITTSDFMPVYGKEKSRPIFSGRRIERGLYLCKAGYCINADCNGAANILRKAVPDAWTGRKDFRFLGFPASIGFKKLNPSDSHKRYLQHPEWKRASQELQFNSQENILRPAI